MVGSDSFTSSQAHEVVVIPNCSQVASSSICQIALANYNVVIKLLIALLASPIAASAADPCTSIVGELFSTDNVLQIRFMQSRTRSCSVAGVSSI